MSWLFPRPNELDGAALYSAIVAETRRADWYRAAAVPDSIDGRFAVLSSLLALADIRLGQGGKAAMALAPRLAERFIADMDAQMREAGFGDPGLGKQVRMMVGSLASRIERFQLAVDQGRIEQRPFEQDSPWNGAVVPSLYRDSPPDGAAIEAGSDLLRGWWQRLGQAKDEDLVEGRLQ